MGVFFDIQHLPEFKNAVLTTGTFDGVHQGHRAILDKVVQHAKKVNGTSVLLTFEPHPRKLLFPEQPLGIITPLNKKLLLLQEAGIEQIVVVPFTLEFSRLSARDYVEKFLMHLFHPHSIVIGYDHRFGNDRKGNLQLLEQYAREYNYELIEIPPQLIDAAAISSTKIRHALLEGRVGEATQMLGRNYSMTGTVVHGSKLGRTIGYPTANISPADKDQIVPGIGIYAVVVTVRNRRFGGMLSIGYNPTVTDSEELRIEVHIFDFEEDIYGETIDIAFVQYLRAEKKFDSLDSLKKQLHRDKEDSLKVL